MLTLLFEDRLVVDEDRYVGMSYLLKQACEKLLHYKIEFSETNCSLLEKAKELAVTDNVVIAFLDVVVDNKNSTMLYQHYINTLITEQITNIILFPIPCIEFYFIDAFSNLVSDREVVRQMLDLQSTGTFKLQGGSLKSFEKVCKRIVSKYMPVDVCNSSFVKTELSFYNGYYGITDEPRDYSEKCELFINKLFALEDCKSIKRVLIRLTEQLSVQAEKYRLTLSPLRRECTNFEYLTSQHNYLRFLDICAEDIINMTLFSFDRVESLRR